MATTARAPVSVVIPSYNMVRLLPDAVESVLAQSLPPAEVVVADDGSTDDTAERLRAFGDRVRHIRQPNGGLASARNFGVRAAVSEWVAFLDADDVWHPHKLETQMAVLATRGDLGVLGTDRFSWPAREFPEVGPPDATPVVPVSWGQLVVSNRIPGSASSVLVRRSVLDRLGGFDEELKSSEDRDFWIRAAEVTGVAYLAAPLAGIRNVPGSLSKQTVVVRTNMLRMLAKIDSRGAWRGRGLLHRKAYGYAYHMLSYVEASAGHPLTALADELRSVAYYPLPFHRDEVGAALERPRRAAVTVLRMLGLKPAEPAPRPVFEGDAPDALRALMSREGVAR